MTTAGGIYQSTVKAELPPTAGGDVAGIGVPTGRLMSARAKGGYRGDAPLLWVSSAPVENVAELWKSLARAFPDTGLWPLVVVPTHGIDRMPEVMMDVPRSVDDDPADLLRRWWDKDYGDDEDEIDEETLSPFGRTFPGLAPRSPSWRSTGVDRAVRFGTSKAISASSPSVVLRRRSEIDRLMGSAANYYVNPTGAVGDFGQLGGSV